MWGNYKKNNNLKKMKFLEQAKNSNLSLMLIGLVNVGVFLGLLLDLFVVSFSFGPTTNIISFYRLFVWLGLFLAGVSFLILFSKIRNIKIILILLVINILILLAWFPVDECDWRIGDLTSTGICSRGSWLDY
jgi:F0F1-type ATP synthase assembly protein I